jgi:hypothetical protein
MIGVDMIVRKTLLAIALAGSFVVPFAVHAAGVSVDVDIAPPPPIHEELAPRAGYVVTPGYYKYDAEHHKHVWVKGEYVPERHGEHYVAPEWREKEGRYHFNEGHWDRDK